MSQQKKILLFLWTFLLLLFRPSFLGERFNPIIYFLFIIITGLLFIIDPESNKRYMNKKVVFTLSLILLTVIYFLFQGLLLSNAKKTVINSCVVIFGISICIAYVSRKDNVPHIFKSFINIFFWLSLSAIITFIIFLFCGLDESRIPLIANLSYFFPGYVANHLLLFPFTIVWSSVKIAGVRFLRFSGIFREPGMTQIFLLTAYFLTYFVDVKTVKLKRFIILIGSILTFSTGGLLSFLGGFLMLKLFGKGKIPSISIVTITIISLTIIIVVFATIPQFGFFNKMSSESGKERLETFNNSLKSLPEAPIFGAGYYNDFRKNNNGVVVTKKDKDVSSGLIGIANQTGFVGLILYIMVWFYGFSRLGNMQTLCIY